MIYAVHRHADYWENPELFDPDRWGGSERVTLKSPFQYIPFSAGPRNCIGQRFAQFETCVLLCQLLKHFEFRLDPQCVDEIRYHETITTKPSGVILQVKRRVGN